MYCLLLTFGAVAAGGQPWPQFIMDDMQRAAQFGSWAPGDTAREGSRLVFCSLGQRQVTFCLSFPFRLYFDCVYDRTIVHSAYRHSVTPHALF